MKNLIVLLLAFTVSYAQAAAFLVTNYEEITNLKERLSSEKITLKRRYLSNKIIDLKSLGFAKTPFYKKGSLVHRDHEDFLGSCFRLTFFESRIQARKMKCAIKTDLKLESYPDFKIINKPFDENRFQEDLTLKKVSIKKSYKGYPFFYMYRDNYINDTSSPQLDFFSFEVYALSTLNISKSVFELKQSVVFNRDKFHYYGEREVAVNQTISVDKGDFLFTNDKGQYILYKRYQPKPLNFKFLWYSADYTDYLSSVDELLYNSKGEKVCFIDYYYDHSDYDCEKLAIKNTVPSQYLEYNLILVDTINPSIILE